MVRVSVLVSVESYICIRCIDFDQNDCLNNIVNAEKRGKRQVLIRPSSKVVVKFLSVMQRHGELTLPSASIFFGVITTFGANLFLRTSRFNAPRHQRL